jgi:hypothetical protein
MAMLESTSLHRDINIKPGAFSGFSAGFDKTVVVFDNPFNNSQADTCAFIIGFAVEPLENFKDLFIVLLFETDAVVFDRKVAIPRIFGQCVYSKRISGTYPAFDNDVWQAVGVGELECIADQIVQ